jgi:hypothetical protein
MFFSLFAAVAFAGECELLVQKTDNIRRGDNSKLEVGKKGMIRRFIDRIYYEVW